MALMRSKFFCSKDVDYIEARALRSQLNLTKLTLRPDRPLYSGLVQFTILLDMYFNYLEKRMEKKMKQVATKVKTGAKAMKDTKKKVAKKVVKKAMPKKSVKVIKKVVTKKSAIKKIGLILPKAFGKASKKS